MLTIVLAMAVVAGEPPQGAFAGRVWGVDMASHSLIVRGVDYPPPREGTAAIRTRRTIRIDGRCRIYLCQFGAGGWQRVRLEDVFHLHDRSRDSDVVLWGRYDRDVGEMSIWVLPRASMSDFTEKYTKGGRP